jgi:CMP-N,N'-diacetyllegionaminic acid synthase
MKIVGLIPARGGSKGIPRKNIVPLAGRPLIAWTIAAASASRGLGRVIVSTDDEEIAEIARAEGAEVPFLRPAALASDEVGALSVIRHGIEWLSADGYEADAVVYLQPTSPFRGSAPIERAIALIEGGDADTVVSVVRVPHAMTPDSLMRRHGDYLEFIAPPEARSFRRQDKPALYARNGPAVLALTRDTAMSRNELYGARIKAIEMSELESHDIDEPADLVVAEALAPIVASERIAGRL